MEVWGLNVLALCSVSGLVGAVLGAVWTCRTIERVERTGLLHGPQESAEGCPGTGSRRQRRPREQKYQAKAT
ncbi:MAG: hypothetical protein HY900_26595 [Deltaproteobacteria bacterium]|nr:hypothetical protein [Deltaproteobacteria bacterium]